MSARKPLILNGPTRSEGKPWFEFRNVSGDKGPVEILIYEQIGKDYWSNEGIGAKDFVENLKTIPTDREITIRINSPGGNVWDGLAIYNQLKLRRDKVTAVIDGVAASTASWLALAAKEVQMPKNALMMIHDPSSMAFGNATEMRKAADTLEKHKEAIAQIYEDKTHQPRNIIDTKMTEETWFNGEDAKKFGLVDTLLADVRIQNTFDFSGFRNVPTALAEKAPQKTAVLNGGQNDKIMDKAKLIALLKEHGKEAPENATEEQLFALLSEVVNKKQKPEPSPANVPAQAIDPNILLVINELKASRDAEKKARIENEVKTCITDCRIPANQLDSWVKRAIADESVLNDIRSLPPTTPGPDAIDIRVISDAPSDVCKGVLNLRKPFNSLLKGNDIDAKTIHRHSIEIANAIRKNGEKLVAHIVNAHSIDSDLQRSVIMNMEMQAFRRRLVPAMAFSTVFQNVPLDGTDKIEVPYFPLFSTASTDFNQTNGYVMAQTGTVQAKEVTIDKRKYQPFEYDSSTLRRQPYLSVARLFSLRVDQLGVDVFNDILSDVTLANFGAAIYANPAAAFTTDAIVDIKTVCEQAFWPLAGRSILLSSTFYGEVVKQLLKVNETGSDSALRKGVTGRIADFDVYDSASVPLNGENLNGFVCLPSCKLVATSPILPGPGVRQQLVRYDVITDPETGLSFEYRFWGDADADEDREVVECNYGYGLGEVAALKRITT